MKELGAGDSQKKTRKKKTSSFPSLTFVLPQDVKHVGGQAGRRLLLPPGLSEALVFVAVVIVVGVSVSLFLGLGAGLAVLFVVPLARGVLL